MTIVGFFCQVHSESPFDLSGHIKFFPTLVLGGVELGILGDTSQMVSTEAGHSPLD